MASDPKSFETILWVLLALALSFVVAAAFIRTQLKKIKKIDDSIDKSKAEPWDDDDDWGEPPSDKR